MANRVEQMERDHKQRIWIVIASLCLLLLTVFILSVNAGYVALSPLELWYTIIGQGTQRQELVLFQFRLPRIVIAMLVGAGLALSGCIMQGISRNEMADPGLLGINAGAGIAVALYALYYPAASIASVLLLPVLGFAGGILAAVLIFAVAYQRQDGLNPTRLILSGIGIAAGISAAMIVLTLRLNPEQYQKVANWLAGAIWGTNWPLVLALLPWIVVLLPYVYFKAQTMNLLTLKEETSRGLGVYVSREQVKLLIAGVALAASCVAVSGGISFVGLIAPHIARRLVGPKHQGVIPVCTLLGALLVLVADTMGRTVLQPIEVPAGILTAVIGAPYFLYLMVSSRR